MLATSPFVVLRNEFSMSLPLQRRSLRGRRIVVSLAVAALALGSTVVLAGPAQAAGYQGKIACSDHATFMGFDTAANLRYKPGGWCLDNGTQKLAFQSDGNLVLYSGSTVLWASNTATTSGYLNFQVDGNVVIYNGNGSAVWASKTGGHGYPNYSLRLSGKTASIDGYSSSGATHLLWRVS